MIRLLPIVPLLAVAVLGAPRRAGAEDTPAPSVAVSTVALQQQELEQTVTGFGSVGTSEEATVDISFPHAGQITALSVRPGERVAKGQELASITADPATLLGYRKAVAALDFARRDLTRVKLLRAQHLMTNADLANAQKAVADASADVEAQRKLGNDQALRIAAAPFGGYVAKLMVAPGDRLAANTAILQLARTDLGVRVTVGLKPDDAAKVTPGMAARVVPVLSADQHPLDGTVRQVGGILNPATRLVDTWVDIPQGAGALIAGTSATATIVVARHKGWVVPRNAVLRDDAGSHIFQVAGGEARRVEVNTGVETDTLTEITGAFDPALKVVTLGNYELQDKMAVREAPAVAQ